VVRGFINHILCNTPYTSPTSIEVGLCTVSPTESGGGTEVTGAELTTDALVVYGAGATLEGDTVLESAPTVAWVAGASFDGDSVLGSGALDENEGAVGLFGGSCPPQVGDQNLSWGSSRFYWYACLNESWQPRAAGSYRPTRS